MLNGSHFSFFVAGAPAEERLPGGGEERLQTCRVALEHTPGKTLSPPPIPEKEKQILNTANLVNHKSCRPPSICK